MAEKCRSSAAHSRLDFCAESALFLERSVKISKGWQDTVFMGPTALVLMFLSGFRILIELFPNFTDY